MATTYLPDRRGALYCITQAVDDTYLAPTQASDKALAVIDAQVSWLGGAVRVEDDLTPSGGGQVPYMGDIAAKLALTIRLPAWPGSRNLADLPALGALLASCPMTPDYSGSTARFTPLSSLVLGAAGTIKPASMTLLETGGDVWSFKNCVSILESIETKDGALVATFTVHGILRSFADTIMTLSAASLTIADVAYTATSPALGRAGTLTLTGATGSGVFAVRSVKWVPGQVIEEQGDRLATFGYAVSAAQNKQNSMLAMTVTKLDESAKAIVADFLAQTALTAVSLAFGSGADRVLLGCGTVARFAVATPGADAGVKTLDIEIVGAPSSAGNDQFLLEFGT